MSRPTIMKHKWWRFWRRSYWGLNPWRWDTLDMPKQTGEFVYFDGMHHPGDGLGGTFGQPKPIDMDIPGKNDVLGALRQRQEWYSRRFKPLADNRSWIQRKSMYGYNPFYRIHPKDIKWYGTGDWHH